MDWTRRRPHPSELRHSAHLSPSLCQHDYITHYLWDCVTVLELSTYIFQTRELILVLSSFPCAWHVR